MRLLFVDSSSDDATCVIEKLRTDGVRFTDKLVRNEDELRVALAGESWSAVVAEDHNPALSGRAVMSIVRELAADVPVILVSSRADESCIVPAMRAGATDYFFKADLVRLAPALEREVRDAAFRVAWRRAATELHSNRQLLVEAETIARLGSWEEDLTSGQVTWSDEARRMYGLPATGGTLDQVFSCVVHPADRDRIRALYAAAREARTPWSADFRIIEGEAVRVIHSSGRFITDGEGKAVRAFGIAQDITERVQHEEDLKRVAIQQAAVANVGRLALSGISLDFLMRQVSAFVAAVLEVELSEILRKDENQLLLVAGEGWSEGLVGRARIDMSRGSQPSFTIAQGTPVILENVATERRFTPSELVVRHGAVSGITVGIDSAEGTTWGVLGAYSTSLRTFHSTDIDFLRTIAVVLGQAIERTRAEDELRSRAAQQSAIAELGRASLTAFDQTTLERAVQLVSGALGTDRTVFFEFSAESKELRVRAGRWIPDSADRFSVDDRNHVGLAVLSGEPQLIVDDRSDAPARPSATAPAAGRFASGVAVPVACGNAIYGVLSAYHESRRRFSASDVDFLQAIANVLAEAMDRDRSHRNLQLVLESTIEGMYTMDFQGRCTMINAAAARMLGGRPEAFLGQNMHHVIHSRRADGSRHEESDCPIHEVLRTRAAKTVTNDLFWKLDGSAVPVDYSAAPIMDNGVAVGSVIAFTDISERLKYEQKLEQASRLSSLGRLGATVAHEFNNVLMGIAPFVDVLRRHPHDISSAVEHIGRAVTRGKRITQDILRFTQPAQPNRLAFEVSPWLEALVDEIRSMLARHYQLTFDAVDVPEVNADAMQLHQILMNLVLNARDAMPDGGPIHISVRREPSGARFPFGAVDHPERFAHFSVSDRGSGMSPETLDRIFEPLFTTKRNGTGLGLAVTHQVVRRHDGEIFVESEVGYGSTFHIFIPLATSGRKREAEHTIAPPATPASGMALTVLLVEDDDAVSSGLEALLSMEGIVTDHTDTGAGALDYLRSRRPDVVILDVGLPDMDGKDVFRQISNTYPDLPVVFSTGHADPLQLSELPSNRPVRYLHKPFETTELIAAIHSALED